MVNENTDSKFDDKFSLEIQKKFISLLIFDKNWAVLNGFDIIKPECFENNLLKNICAWIHHYYQKYKALPTQAIITEQAQEYVNKHSLGLETFLLYKDMIAEIFTRDDNDNTTYYKDRVVIFARQAAWKQALAKGTEVLAYGNYEEALNAFKKVLAVGSETDLGIDFSKLPSEDFLDMLMETYDPKGMIKTGLPGWDRALGGGFAKDNLHIIAAPPGGGKSRTMAFLAKNMLKDRKRVVYITLEISELETITNINTSATGISQYDMVKPEVRNEFLQKITAFKQMYGKDLFVKFYKPATVTADTIHNYIQRLIQERTEELGYEWKPDVIFIDYLDKLLPTQKLKGSIYEDVGSVADDCKNLAITFNCPVITGSQLGRFGWNVSGADVVTMDSIAESAKKVHLAHSMTTINMNVSEKEAHRARLYLAKSRTGISGAVIWCGEYDLGRIIIAETEPWDPKTLQSTSAVTIKDVTRK